MQFTTHQKQGKNTTGQSIQSLKICHSKELVFVKGQRIYNAAIEGAKRGYNRTFSDCTIYEELISKVFLYHLNTCNTKKELHAVMKSTKGDWRNAFLPVCLVMHHQHKGGVPCELHARVYLPPFMGDMFDIPWDIWEYFVESCPKLGS